MPELPTHDERPLIDFCFAARMDYARGYRLMLEGHLRGRRVGKRWYVRLDANARQLLAGRGEPVTQTA